KGMPNASMQQAASGAPLSGTSSVPTNPFSSAELGMSPTATSAASGIARSDMALASRNLPTGSMPMNDAMSPSAGSVSPSATEGSGKPGDKKLEGAQSPSVTIEKIAPPEIQVGKPAKFEIVVRNTGPVPAENVEVTDIVPQGTTLISTTPNTLVGQHGE